MCKRCNSFTITHLLFLKKGIITDFFLQNSFSIYFDILRRIKQGVNNTYFVGMQKKYFD